MNHEREIIALDSSTDEDSENPVIEPEDWDPTPIDDNYPENEVSTIDPHNQYDECLRSVIECFPDISHDHVQTLYSEYLGSVELTEVANVTEVLIGRILDRKTYPKEKDRLKDLKRKRSKGEADDKAEAAKWKTENQDIDTVTYTKISRSALQESFPMVPLRYIDAKFKQHGNLYGTYRDIADTERRYSQLDLQPYSKLKARRFSNGPRHDDLMRRIRHKESARGQKLELELQAAHERRLKDDDIFELEAREQAVITAREQEERDRGEILECGCCFDSIPMSRITQCNADTAHFFCFDCARMNAENDIGMNRFALACMDGSSCQATFSKTERSRFLDEKTLAKIDSLEQQASIQGAMSEFFDFVTCPFCEYGHICPPVEEDKEFRCGFPDCKEISCRLCKERTHVPMTCEESRRDQGISERHVIEEARTEALLRSCPKCKVRILKEDGCNKVVCTTCRSAICDYCGKDITMEQYAHFEGRDGLPPAANNGSKCPLYDLAKDRKDKQIGAAEQQAKENIRKENPGISEEDLEIRFSNEVKKADTDHARDHFLPGPAPGVVPPARRHRFNAVRYQVPRHPALNHGLVPPLGPIANHPILQPQQPQQPQHNAAGHGLDMWQHMFIPDHRPENPVAGPALPNELPYQRLDANNLHTLNLRQLEQEAALKRQQLQELHQARLARLQEQQAQTTRQLRAQADALRDAGLQLPPQPQVRVPFRHPQTDLQAIGLPTNIFPGMPPQAHDIPQRNMRPNTTQEEPVVGARRNRHRHPAFLG